MSQNIITIDNITVYPGERKTIMLPTPKLYDWTPLNIPVHVINGKSPGPVLCITAAIHGDEINGVEIVRRLLKKNALKKISGTLIAIPIVNVYGFLHQNRYLMDRRDLNRAFPGNEQGSLAARLACLIRQQVLTQVTHCVDLHSGSLHRTNLPQIRMISSSAKVREMAMAFDVAVILQSRLPSGSIRQYLSQLDIPCLLFEAGEAMRFDEFSINVGMNGILNVMRVLNMLNSNKKTPARKCRPRIAKTSYWVRSSYSGIFQSIQRLGDIVKKGDVLAVIANPTGSEEHKLISPISGIVIGKNNAPLVYDGAALFHIACFDELKQVEKQIEMLQEFYGDDITEGDSVIK